jgi:hypothetical protein
VLTVWPTSALAKKPVKKPSKRAWWWGGSPPLQDGVQVAAMAVTVGLAAAKVVTVAEAARVEHKSRHLSSLI